MSHFETTWRSVVTGEETSWWSGPSRAALALLSGLYGAGVSVYRAAYDRGWLVPERLDCPVVSIGNLTVGGTGKTTAVRWLARRMAGWGLRPAILSHGYRAAGGKRSGRRGPVVVAGPEGVRAGADRCGDEPLLLALSLPGVPVVAGKRRVESGRRARRELGAGSLLLDDGFQYWPLARDVEIVLVSALEPFGPGGLLPRGTLREPPGALRRAHAVVLTHADEVAEAERARIREAVLRWNPRLALAEARHAPGGIYPLGGPPSAAGVELRGRRLLALSSIGAPESFERIARRLGVEVEPARFPDHHRYSPADLEAVARRAESGGFDGIVTTEKDAVKIAPDWLHGVPCWIVPVELEFLSGREDLEALVRDGVRVGSAG